MHQVTYNPHPQDESLGAIRVDHVQLQGVVEAVDKREWMRGDARNGTKAGRREERQAG